MGSAPVRSRWVRGISDFGEGFKFVTAPNLSI